jgi:AcrR family transcriptional regulator
MSDAPRTVGQHHPGDLRRELLDAALGLLRQGEAPSLRAVARAAGVSPGAPYHHFASKGALMAAMAAEGFWALEAAFSDQAGLDGEERLRAVAEVYVRFARSNPARYGLMFDGALDHADAALHDAIVAAFAHWVAAVVEAVGERDALGRATRSWGLAHGLVGLEHAGTLRAVGRDAAGLALVDDVVEGVVDLVRRRR